MEIDEGTPVAPAAPVSLDILMTVKTSQAQNGLRHGNYQRYRQYCSRRLKRLRDSLKLNLGKGKFQAKAVTADIVSDARHLLLPLVQCERAWALAMELKADQGKSGRPDPRKRFHLVRRLAKAARVAKDLEQLCSKRADAKTALESEAYATFMQANELLERENWSESLAKFMRARTIYDQLARVADPAQQRVYEQRVEEIDPSVRYCRYNLKKAGVDDSSAKMDVDDDIKAMEKNMDDPSMDLLRSKLEGVISESRRQAAEQMRTVEYRGATVPIRSDKVRLALVSAADFAAQAAKEEKHDKRLDLYGQTFSQLEEARKCIKNDLIALTTAGQKRGEAAEATAALYGSGPAATAELNALLAYASETLLRRTIERNLLLVAEQAAKMARAEGRRAGPRPEDLVRLYDTLLQNAAELAGVAGAEEEAGALSGAFRACRCLHLAEGYAAAEKWAEAVALYDRCRQHAAPALQRLKKMPKVDPAVAERAEKAAGAARAQRLLAHAHAVLKAEASLQAVEEVSLADAQAAQGRGLLGRLGSYEGAAGGGPVVLAEFPPAFEPVACKPALFDLAFNAIEYPDVSAHAPAQKKGGILGFFRRK
eukprot:tig00020554_g10940.t1